MCAAAHLWLINYSCNYLYSFFNVTLEDYALFLAYPKRNIMEQKTIKE